jgi:HSP20 family molecular chaperone IbpA
VDKRRDLENAAEEIEQLFADLWQVFPFSRGLRRSYRPQVDVYRGEDPPGVTILIELPGVDPSEVQLVASPRALLIAGERRRPQDCGHYQQMEIDYGPFQTSIPRRQRRLTSAGSSRYGSRSRPSPCHATALQSG